MDVNTIVELIQLATVENPRKLQSTQILDQLRVSPERWSVGLRLFLETQNEMGRFFGLSLVRDWMQCELAQSQSAPTISTAREQIRRTMMAWLNDLLQQVTKSATTNIASSVPYYLLSNAVSVVTLSIKFDFPAFWPTAFTELLQLGYTHGIPGIDLVVRVLKELEVEVVMFSETRSKAEVAQNTVVKDAMRESSIVREIVSFLCQSTQHTLSAQRADICAACLHSLAELIAWIDASLVVQEALPVIYQLWQCPESTIRAAVAFCFFELVKKGMDPVVKVRLLHTIGLVPQLTQDERIRTLLQGTDTSEAETKELEQVSTLVDIIVIELLGCWCKYEDMVCGGSGKSGKGAAAGGGGGGGGSGASTDSESAELFAAIPAVVRFLDGLLPLLLDCFVHPSLKVSCNALPSCTRLVAILKQQQARAPALDRLASANGSVPAGSAAAGVVFQADAYLNALLRGVYAKSQYPLDFDFDAALEDELDEEVEAKGEVRKLFVNCCRVRPDRCLELLCAVLQSQPLPLSTAPYPPLEAALRLVHAFSECGPSQNKLLSEGPFPSLIRALQDSDLVMHPHPQVVLVYFEISHRYIRHLDKAAILRLVQSLLGRQGVRCGNNLVRGRAAYFLLKVAESQEGKAANLIESVYTQLSEILTDTASVELRSAFSKKSPISEQSEMYLCETVALLTSHFSAGFNNNDNGSSTGTELLRAIVDAQLSQMHTALCLFAEQPQLTEALCAVVTRRMSALAGLTKGFSCKANPAAVSVFEQATTAVVAVAQRLSFQRGLRAKILVFLHRMVSCIGERILPYEEQVLPALLAAADATDADDVVQVLNQLMVEYGRDALSVVDKLFLSVVDKYSALSATLESSSTTTVATTSISSTSTDTTTTTVPGVVAPHLQSERLSLHRQYLLFLQHLACFNCAATLFNPAHLHRLEGILYSVVLEGISGGSPAGQRGATEDTSSSGNKVNPSYLASTDSQDSAPVRKGALSIVNGLVSAWLLPPGASAPTTGISTISPGGSLSSAAAVLPDPPTAEVAQAFRSYLLEQALPRALYSVSAWCTQPPHRIGAQLNVKDAAAQSVLVEMALLLRDTHLVLSYQTTSGVSNPAESVAYFQNVLRSLGWPEHRVQGFLQHLTAPTPLGTFKEAFKLFIRECSS